MKYGSPVSILAFAILPLLFHACHHGKTVNQRIDRNPALFHTKSFDDKKLISRGTIAAGMTRDAVYLAWGNPKSRSEGVENGKTFEEWSYQKLKPKLDFNIGLGTRGLEGPDIGLDRTVSKTVRFEKGRVTGFRIHR